MTTAVYPDFQPVVLGVKPALCEYVQRFPPYSDFSVWNLMSWASQYRTSYAFLNGNLVIRGWDCYDDKDVYSLLGADRIDESLRELCQLTTCLELIPEVVIQNLIAPRLFTVEEDRDNYDYILSTERLARLSGNSLYSVRAEVSRFPKCYPNHQIRFLDFGNAGDRDEVIALTQVWCERKGLYDSGIIQGVDSFIRYAPFFCTLSLGLYIGKKMVAFNMNEIVSGKTAITHFALGDIDYEGSSRYITCTTAKMLYHLGYVHINYEQDMGMLGVRQAKLAYRPVAFLRKYRVSLTKSAITCLSLKTESNLAGTAIGAP